MTPDQQQVVGAILATLAALLMIAGIVAGLAVSPADRHRMRDEDEER